MKHPADHFRKGVQKLVSKDQHKQKGCFLTDLRNLTNEYICDICNGGRKCGGCKKIIETDDGKYIFIMRPASLKCYCGLKCFRKSEKEALSVETKQAIPSQS